MTHHKIFVYCKLGVTEQKLERSLTPFGLASYFELLKSEIRPTGDGKIHVSANESILVFGEMISL